MGGAEPGMVIVGAGEAGGRAALALRERGWTGGITLVGDEGALPYERPPLSKAVMTAAGDPVARVIATEAQLAAAGIAFLHDEPAVRIDRAARVVELGGGRLIPYRALLLATGCVPRRLPLPGAEHALYLRTFVDALALRARLRPGSRLLVIGGGFIGLEVAASAVARGCAVVVLEVAPRILMRGVPDEIAAIVAARHRAAGVELRIGEAFAAIRVTDRGGTEVDLGDGTRVAGDAVVAGIGALPVTALAEACGLAIENGIRVDAHLRTGDSFIHAAGDCCSFPLPLYDGARVRLEAWRNASAQGALAARTMLGEDVTYDAVPWFWSDQFDLTLQVAGLPQLAARAVRRDVPGVGLMVFHLATDGRLIAVSGVGLPALAKDIRAAEHLVARRAYPDPAALASPAVKLRALLAV